MNVCNEQKIGGHMMNVQKKLDAMSIEQQWDAYNNAIKNFCLSHSKCRLITNLTFEIFIRRYVRNWLCDYTKSTQLKHILLQMELDMRKHNAFVIPYISKALYCGTPNLLVVFYNTIGIVEVVHGTEFPKWREYLNDPYDSCFTEPNHSCFRYCLTYRKWRWQVYFGKKV